MVRHGLSSVLGSTILGCTVHETLETRLFPETGARSALLFLRDGDVEVFAFGLDGPDPTLARPIDGDVSLAVLFFRCPLEALGLLEGRQDLGAGAHPTLPAEPSSIFEQSIAGGRSAEWTKIEAVPPWAVSALARLPVAADVLCRFHTPSVAVERVPVPSLEDPFTFAVPLRPGVALLGSARGRFFEAAAGGLTELTSLSTSTPHLAATVDEGGALWLYGGGELWSGVVPSLARRASIEPGATRARIAASRGDVFVLADTGRLVRWDGDRADVLHEHVALGDVAPEAVVTAGVASSDEGAAASFAAWNAAGFATSLLSEAPIVVRFGAGGAFESSLPIGPAGARFGTSAREVDGHIYVGDGRGNIFELVDGQWSDLPDTAVNRPITTLDAWGGRTARRRRARVHEPLSSGVGILSSDRGGHRRHRARGADRRRGDGDDPRSDGGLGRVLPRAVDRGAGAEHDLRLNASDHMAGRQASSAVPGIAAAGFGPGSNPIGLSGWARARTKTRMFGKFCAFDITRRKAESQPVAVGA